MEKQNATPENNNSLKSALDEDKYAFQITISIPKYQAIQVYGKYVLFAIVVLFISMGVINVVENAQGRIFLNSIRIGFVFLILFLGLGFYINKLILPYYAVLYFQPEEQLFHFQEYFERGSKMHLIRKKFWKYSKMRYFCWFEKDWGLILQNKHQIVLPTGECNPTGSIIENIEQLNKWLKELSSIHTNIPLNPDAVPQAQDPVHKIKKILMIGLCGLILLGFILALIFSPKFLVEILGIFFIFGLAAIVEFICSILESAFTERSERKEREKNKKNDS